MPGTPLQHSSELGVATHPWVAWSCHNYLLLTGTRTCFYPTSASAPAHHHMSTIPCRSLQYIEVGAYCKEEKKKTDPNSNPNPSRDHRQLDGRSRIRDHRHFQLKMPAGGAYDDSQTGLPNPLVGWQGNNPSPCHSPRRLRCLNLGAEQWVTLYSAETKV